MDEILYLEPDEEITSVIDKIKKSNSDSIGLVIPRNSSLIHSIVNLKLLKKQADALDREIALVTADRIGKNIAGQVGLPVYEDVHAKRPVSVAGMGALPKGDEVIEVDMSNGASDDKPAKNEEAGGGPRIKHYDAGEDAAKNRSIKATRRTPVSAVLPDDTIEPDDADFTDRGDITVSDGMVETISEHGEPVVEDLHMPHAEPIKTSSHQMAEVAPAVASRFKFERNHRAHDGQSQRGSKLVIGLVCLLIALLAASLLGLPQTNIAVTVAADALEKSIPVTVDKSATAAIAENQTVPGTLLEVSNDDARRVVATGKKDAGTKAKGQIVISNAWDSNPLKLSAGTTITSVATSKTYTLDNDVTVPGVTLALTAGQLVTTPGTATAAVTASDPGDSYNIKPGTFTINSLTAAQQQKITGQSSKDFTGGASKTVTIVTQADIDSAKDAMMQDLNKQASEQLKKDAKDQRVIDNAIDHEIVSAETNPDKVGAETDYFDLKIKAKHRVIVFNEKVVQSVIVAALQKEVPADKQLLLDDTNEFSVDVQDKDYDNGKMILSTDIKTKIGQRVDAKQIKQTINGKSAEAVKEKLMTSVPNIKDVTVEPFPRWWWQATSFAPWNTHLTVLYR